MYKVLYRKWRPKTFDEVIGQEYVVDVLRKHVLLGSVPHALMFCGARGTGKTSCAKIFAKAINCLNSKNGNPCLECEMCRGIESSSVLDVSEIDAASNNGVENIRSIIGEVNLAPSSAKYRVYIIDEFHMLSSGAFNAFLRTLEEPPKNVVFILATTEYHKIPRTIVSRCQKFDFHRINSELIKKRLKFVSEKENFLLDDKIIDLISRSSEGSVRDALSMLDQCANFGGDVDESLVCDLLGISDFFQVEGIFENIFSDDLKGALLILRKLHEKGINMVYLCDTMMSFFHDLFCYKSSGILFDSCNFSKDFISKISSSFSLDIFLKCFDILKDTYIKMQKVPNKVYEIEEALLRISSLMKNKNVRDDVKTISSVDKEKLNKVVVERETLSDDDLSCGLKRLESWGEIVKRISKISSSLSSMLSSTNAYVSDDSLMIDTNSLVFGMIKKSCESIRQIVFDVTSKNYKICKLDKKNSDLKNNLKDSKNKDINSLIEKASSEGIQMTIN